MERIELCGTDSWSGVSKGSRLQDLQWIGGTVWRRGREQTSQKFVFAGFSVAVLAPMSVREAHVYKHRRMRLQ